jgi:hypothetical protein
MSSQNKNLRDLPRDLATDQELQKKFTENPADVIRQYQQTPLEKDEWVYRIIVLALGITIFTIVLGVIILIGTGKVSDDKHVPAILTAIGSAAIGAIAGLLVPAPRKQS